MWLTKERKAEFIELMNTPICNCDIFERVDELKRACDILRILGYTEIKIKDGKVVDIGLRRNVEIME